MIENGVNGLLARSPEEMAQQVILLLTDRCRAAQIARAARESWHRRFTLQHYHEQLCAAVIATTSVRRW